MKKGDFYFYLLVSANVPTRLFWHLKKYFNTAKDIVEGALADNHLVPAKTAAGIKHLWANKEHLLAEFKKLNNYFTILDDCYPKLLKSIYDPPLLLFYAGNLKLLKNNYLLSMVGSRHSTSYHQQAAEKIISDFSNTKIAIVSGLAIGLDTICHQAALKNHLPTIAVLGSGMDKASFYPKINFGLSQEIINQGGLVLSEYPNGTKPALHHFPKRNRILAGLSRATIVLSGALKSGTLITAQVALDEGREVFALPGNINQTLCQGPNQLLQNGANILLSGQDVLNFYEINGQYGLPLPNKIFTKDEKIIVDLLHIEPLSLENLLAKTSWPLPALQAVLSSLEIKNIIQTNSDGQVELKW